jgi:hypothetical protein
MRNKLGGAEFGVEEQEYKILATKSQRNRLLMKNQHNIKMDLQEIGPRVWNGFKRISIKFSGGLL